MSNIMKGLTVDEMHEPIDEWDAMYIYDPVGKKMYTKNVRYVDQDKAFTMGYRATPEAALKSYGIIRSKFTPGKFVKKEGGRWVEVQPYSEALDKSIAPQIKNIISQNPKGSAAEKMLLQRYIKTPMVQDFDLSAEEWIGQATKWLASNQNNIKKHYPEVDMSDMLELAKKMYEDFLAMQGKLEETLPVSPGGMGQSYRKYKASPAGLDEEQAPMFTPEEKMVNANDPRSAGWRTYKVGPAGLEENSMNTSDTLKTNALKIIYDTVISDLRGTTLYPTNEEDFIRIASAVLKRQIGRRYPQLSQQQLEPASQSMAKDLLQFFRQEPKMKAYKQVSGDNYTESSILKGLKTIK